MNKYWKDKWLTALRSGEYKQTTGTLKDNVGYCCLGVLSDLVVKELPEQFSWYWNKVNKEYELVLDTNSDSGLLLKEIVDITEVPNAYCIINNSDLTTYNDDEDYTFNQIADLIEEHY